MTAPGQHETPVAAPADDALQLAAPGWAFVMYQNLISGLGALMAAVQVEQTDLDQLKTDLGTIADDLETELAALNVPAGDLTGVRALVDRLRNDVAVPTPAPDPTPTPAPDPAPAPAPEPAAGP